MFVKTKKQKRQLNGFECDVTFSSQVLHKTQMKYYKK